MNLGSVIIVCVRGKNVSRGRIVEANCILESTPPPHFGLDVVYKMGGRINGTLRYLAEFDLYIEFNKWNNARAAKYLAVHVSARTDSVRCHGHKQLQSTEAAPTFKV